MFEHLIMCRLIESLVISNGWSVQFSKLTNCIDVCDCARFSGARWRFTIQWLAFFLRNIIAILSCFHSHDSFGTKPDRRLANPCFTLSLQMIVEFFVTLFLWFSTYQITIVMEAAGTLKYNFKYVCLKIFNKNSYLQWIRQVSPLPMGILVLCTHSYHQARS